MSSHRHAARAVGAALAIAALAAPPALARPATDPPAPAEERAVVQTIDEGFDWGAAGIGAGAAGALIVLVSAGGSVLGGRHHLRVSR